jgi:YspA, cpYpsA-related SLOG family
MGFRGIAFLELRDLVPVHGDFNIDLWRVGAAVLLRRLVVQFVPADRARLVPTIADRRSQRFGRRLTQPPVPVSRPERKARLPWSGRRSTGRGRAGGLPEPAIWRSRLRPAMGAFTGGIDCTDHHRIWAALDKVRAKYADMVLPHGGAPRASPPAGPTAERSRRSSSNPIGHAAAKQRHSSATTRCSKPCPPASSPFPVLASPPTLPTKRGSPASRCRRRLGALLRKKFNHMRRGVGMPLQVSESATAPVLRWRLFAYSR